MGLVSFIYLVCAFRTNICFVIVFLALVMTFVFLTVAYWLLAEDYQGNASAANRFVIVSCPLWRLSWSVIPAGDLRANQSQTSGAFGFVCCAAGWWILFALVLESVNFPFQLPVGDLSRLVKPRAQSVQV